MEFLDGRLEHPEVHVAGVGRADLGVITPHGDQLVERVGAVGLDRREQAVVEHGQGVHEAGVLAVSGDGELGLDQAAAVGRAGGSKAASGLEPGAGLPDGDGSGHPDVAELLGVALHVAAEHGVVLVDPDVGAAAVRLALVGAADHDEALLVLESVGVEHLVEVVGAGLPVGPDDGHRARVVLGGGERGGQQFGHGVRIGAVLDGEHVARVVPRRGGDQRGGAGGGAGEGEALEVGHGSQRIIWSLTISMPRCRDPRREAGPVDGEQ